MDITDLPRRTPPPLPAPARYRSQRYFLVGFHGVISSTLFRQAREENPADSPHRPLQGLRPLELYARQARHAVRS